MGWDAVRSLSKVINLCGVTIAIFSVALCMKSLSYTNLICLYRSYPIIRHPTLNLISSKTAHLNISKNPPSKL